MKDHDFRPMARFNLETIHDTAIVRQQKTNRNSYAIYQMVPFGALFSDLE